MVAKTTEIGVRLTFNLYNAKGGLSDSDTAEFRTCLQI